MYVLWSLDFVGNIVKNQINAILLTLVVFWSKSVFLKNFNHFFCDLCFFLSKSFFKKKFNNFLSRV